MNDSNIKSELLKLLCENRENDIVCKDLNGNIIDTKTFAQKVIDLSKWLRDNSKEQIIVCENNSIELLLLYFAAIFSNKTVIPLDPEKKEDEKNLIRKIHSDASYFDVGEITKIVTNIVSYEEGCLNWEEVDFDRLYLITYTSGSTGQPKGVKHSLYNLLYSAYEFGKSMEYGIDTVLGHCMPMTYMAGILNTIFIPFLMGGTIVILPRFSALNSFTFWKDVENGNVNTLWLSPTMLRLASIMDKRGNMREYFKNCNMKISVGTSPLDIKLRNEFEAKYSIRLYQSYGLSETLFITTESLCEEVSNHTVGKLLPSVELFFTPVEEIYINVPWMFLGYTNTDTSEYMQDGMYKSGDLGNFIGDNLVITGRCKELIVKGGYNINPHDIENEIIGGLECQECAVISVSLHGEEVIIAVVGTDADIQLKDINKKIIHSLGEHYRVDYLEKLKSLPKNLNGKIDKIKIKKDMEEKYGTKD